ncbi:hypothetical protein CsSME_00015214 [Camellia sinensis var. sinensis]
MTDDSPHDGAPPEVSPVFLPVIKTEEPVTTEASEAAQGIEADLKAEFEPDL